MSRPRWRLMRAEYATTLVLGLLSATVVGFVAAFPDDFPFTPLMVPLLLSALLLSRERMVWFGGYTALCLTIVALLQPELTPRTISALAVQFALCVAVIVVGLRATLGVGRLQGESMLVDLRDRILSQGEIPALPEPWLVESALSSAGGSAFAGDFVVVARRESGRWFEVALVDVSGKGEAAATRALQLSGAMSGLLAALPPEQFLCSSNAFLQQRSWEEGFATAVHLSLDLQTGDFELRTAGHPPAVQRHGGSGRWESHHTEGAVLGLLDDVEFAARRGRLAPGDMLLLYTDGMVEVPGRDIEVGVDAMIGAAERLAVRSWEGIARRLVSAVGSADDDRAVVAVHRRPA